MDIDIIQTKIGLLQITSQQDSIINVEFVKNKSTTDNNKLIIADILNYFNGISTKFTSKYIVNGNSFQKSVWVEIEKIPYGETKTYGQIAEAIGKPKAYRAVANACGQNKLALLIPCHRVVGKSNIGGYHWGIDIKKQLLELEKVDNKTVL